MTKTTSGITPGQVKPKRRVKPNDWQRTVDDMFDHFATQVAERFQRRTANGEPLFEVEVDDPLYRVYLTAFADKAQRQHHTCACCRQFIERYGRLVTIDDKGMLKSVVWGDTKLDPPTLYAEPDQRMQAFVETGRVTGVFYSDENRWGTPKTGKWDHFAVKPAQCYLNADLILSAHQRTAQSIEDHRTLSRGIVDFKRSSLATAITLLEGGLYRSEKVMGPARFLLELHDKLASAKMPSRRVNLIWKAVAVAPPGFCTPRSSMIGTLLEDIENNIPVQAIATRFKAKMAADQYQRPQAPPSVGTIAQAEKLVGKLGLEASLHRRYARLNEIPLLWKPGAIMPDPMVGTGVFSHLKTPAETTHPVAGVQQMTWVKFRASVMPKARKIQVRLHGGPMNLGSILTAVDPNAPPILQWDRDDMRNPCSWYVYLSGSLAPQWGLRAATFIDVTGITLKPSLWSEEGWEGGFDHHGVGAVFLLKDAKDARQPGLCLFPETLRKELHGVRAVIEAHSASRQPEGKEEGSASGLLIVEKGAPQVLIRVTTNLGVSDYEIDRWD